MKFSIYLNMRVFVMFAHSCSPIRVLQGTLWVAKGLKRLQADSEDSYQTARMRELICLRWAHRISCRKSCAPAQISVLLSRVCNPKQYISTCTMTKIAFGSLSQKHRIPFKPVLGGVCRLTNYSITSMARTRMARLPWMIRTLFFSPYKILPIT